MHPARKAAFVFLGLIVVDVASSAIFAALTPDKQEATRVGGILVAVAFVFLLGAIVSLVVWRMRR